MNAARAWLPHPLLSAVLLLAWLWLNNSVHPGTSCSVRPWRSRFRTSRGASGPSPSWSTGPCG